MLSWMKIKRQAMSFATAFFPAMLLLLTLLLTNDIFIAIGVSIISMVIFVFLLGFMTRHAFRGMMEGDGINIFDFNGTGIIGTYLAKVIPPYINFKIGKEIKETTFDTNIVHRLLMPQIAYYQEKEITCSKCSNTEDGLHLFLPKNQYGHARFSTSGVPSLVYNSTLGIPLTKDWISDKESQLLNQHLAIYIKRKVEDLSLNVRDFARYAVEQLRPKKGIWEQLGAIKWVIIIIIGALVIAFIISMLGTGSVQQGISSLGGMVSAQTQPITPTG